MNPTHLLRILTLMQGVAIELVIPFVVIAFLGGRDDHQIRTPRHDLE